MIIKTKTTMAYKDKRSRPGLYYGSDNLIKLKDGTWVEDPKTFKPVRKASNKNTNTKNIDPWHDKG